MNKEINHYYLAISDKDNLYISITFKINKNKNIKYTIFIAIDAYDINIHNLNIKFIVK